MINIKRKEYLNWNETFMNIAVVMSYRSKDPKRQVGAVIIKNNKIISTGYNGLTYGMNDDEITWEKSEDFEHDKNSFVVHAEANAIVNASQIVTGSILYVTLFPCNECAKLIVQSGIKKVLYLNEWKDNKVTRVSKKILSKGGVKYIKINTKVLKFQNKK